jgi:phage terminase small subunit
MRKPKTTEIFSPEPPGNLSERAKTLWLAYAGPVLKSPGQLALFQSGLEALDRAAQARELIAKEGLTIATDRGKIAHQHPALNILKEAEATTLKVFKTLCLHGPGKWNRSAVPSIEDIMNENY